MLRSWFFRFGLIFACLSLLGLPVLAAQSAAPVLAVTFHNWKLMNQGGFGNVNNISVSALEVYNNQLYAGAYDWSSQPGTGGTVWRYVAASTWDQVPTPPSPDGSTPGFTTPFSYAILGMRTFNGYLYVTTGWGGHVGRVWRYDGTTWEKVLEVGDPEPVYGFTSLAVFNNQLYVGASLLNTDTPGTRIYRSSTGDLNSWQLVVSDGNGNPGSFTITGMQVFGTSLYAAVSNYHDGVQVWKTDSGDPGTWNTMIGNGFGYGNHDTDPGGFAVFNNELYLGFRDMDPADLTLSTGGKIFKTDGATWSPVVTDGFGNVNNQKVEGMSVFQNVLYAFTSNPVTGMEIWMTTDGKTWSNDMTGGFGNHYNKNTLWSSAQAIYNSQLFVGTSNYDPVTHLSENGGEVWASTPAELTNTLFLPNVQH